MRYFVRTSYVLVLMGAAIFPCHIAVAKERKNESRCTVSTSEVSWQKDRKLTWSDFRGPVPEDAEAQTAAATFCGIGFETNTITNNSNDLTIRVYNTFYLNNSWARSEEMNDNVLAHEQGHFDLCELYTRKLRERMSNIKVNAHTLKPILRKVYEDLQEEYKNRQAAYEAETAHGVNMKEQEKWQIILERELLETEHLSEN